MATSNGYTVPNIFGTSVGQWSNVIINNSFSGGASAITFHLPIDDHYPKPGDIGFIGPIEQFKKRNIKVLDDGNTGWYSDE